MTAAGTKIAERWADVYADAVKGLAPDTHWLDSTVAQLIEELSASEERVRVLTEALKKARMYAIHGCGTKQKDVRGKQFGSIIDIANTALDTPAPEQPAQTKKVGE